MYPMYAAHVPDVGAGADGLGRILGRIQEQVRAPYYYKYGYEMGGLIVYDFSV
jgi:hypothetical protein